MDVSKESLTFAHGVSHLSLLTLPNILKAKANLESNRCTLIKNENDMKKAFFISVIILLCVAGGIYYHFFFDTRNLLKSDTESIVNHLSRIGIGEVFDLSEDCTPSDSVYVVAPYSSDFFEKNPHLELMSCIKRDIERATMFDSYFQLLFVKGNKVVSHATINRDIVSYFGLDFCNIYNTNQKFHIKTKLYLDEHRIVHQK